LRATSATSERDPQESDRNTRAPIGSELTHQAHKRKSWRDVLPVHPAADLFPMMSPDELRELGEDIRKNQQLQTPIVLIGVDKSPIRIEGRPVALLDGRNRLDALELSGHRIDFELVSDDDRRGPRWYALGQQIGIAVFSVAIRLVVLSKTADPYAHVLSLNVHRRHLTAEQKREIIAKVLKAKPGQSNLAIAKQVKADDKTVASVRRDLEARSEIPNVDTRRDTKGRKQPAKKKRRDVDDFLAEKRARLAAAADASKDDDPRIENEIEPDNYRIAFLLRADQALQFAVYSGPVDREVADAARAVERAWGQLVRRFEDDEPLEIPPILRRTA
jgi:hypothetical protein